MNGGSHWCLAVDDPKLRTMAWIMRRLIPKVK